jgi:hypothetical protein
VPSNNSDITKFDCTYCGLVASGKDHVIPVSYECVSRRMASFDRSETCPACTECNCLLGSRWVPSIAERAQFIARILAIRYRELLKTPDWSEDELEEMGTKLRKGIISRIKRRDLTKARIAYAESVGLMNLNPEDCWK